MPIHHAIHAAHLVHKHRELCCFCCYTSTRRPASQNSRGSTTGSGQHPQAHERSALHTSYKSTSQSKSAAPSQDLSCCDCDGIGCDCCQDCCASTPSDGSSGSNGCCDCDCNGIGCDDGCCRCCDNQNHHASPGSQNAWVSEREAERTPFVSQQPILQPTYVVLPTTVIASLPVLNPVQDSPRPLKLIGRHQIRKGDTLHSIAFVYGSHPEDLRVLNSVGYGDDLSSLDTLTVCAPRDQDSQMSSLTTPSHPPILPISPTTTEGSLNAD